RVQRQVHVQPLRAARRLVRHVARPRARDVPQLLSAPDPLAVQRHPSCAMTATNSEAPAGRVSPKLHAHPRNPLHAPTAPSVARKRAYQGAPPMTTAHTLTNEIIDLHPRRADMRAEVLAGLARRPKRLPSKY